jgi:branched-chain amino acid transport system ATP-binding protein
MLEIRKIDVSYGDVRVLREISLKVEEREIFTLVGPNGSGKSTLLRAILALPPCRIDLEEEGAGVFFRGNRIDGLPSEEIVRLGLGVVPEGARVFPEMTILDNLLVGSLTKRAREKRLQSLAEVYDLFPQLRDREARKARTLSGGERQMLAIGRALMSRPDLLLLDEPCLGLQPGLVRRIFETIVRVNMLGVTLLLVEQNVHQSLEISHRACLLEGGRIVLEGSGKDLLGNPHVRTAYLAI